jgi:hypothetical protein
MIGLNIDLPYVQYSNPISPRIFASEFHDFALCKLYLLLWGEARSPSRAGLETLDELSLSVAG